MHRKVPILFLIYNRLKTANHSFECIRAYRPERLYISADGPRPEVEGDVEKCEAVRASILSQIDWPCEIKTRFLDENLGCGLGISSAISWMFDFEEHGVILEDDCWVSQDFFTLCEELLPLYANNENIVEVNSGNSNLFCYETSNSYHFSIYSNIWAWATWKRAWKNFDIQMSAWPSVRKETFKIFPFPENCIRYYLWDSMYKTIQKNQKLNAWSLQWLLYIFFNKKLCVEPDITLNYNFSFNEGDTNNKSGAYVQQEWQTGHLSFPLKHPNSISADTNKDKVISKLVVRSFYCLLIKKLRNLIRCK